MKKPTPLFKEVPFEFHELFFSTTDEKGKITFGNDVFVRISGYPKETVIGAPHNIIRHPDMPRSVFKVFWDTLKSNSPIAAYVKNLAADGRYYWVLAFAFPVANGYLSIRFKPSSVYFTKVQDIYAAVLEHEKDHEIDESTNYLLELLTKAGFANYQEFMVSAAIEELNSREKNLHVSEDKRSIGNNRSVQQIAEVTHTTSRELDNSFSKIASFQDGNHFFSKSVSLLNEEFNKLKFLSINMKVLAGNFGDQAATLGVISQEFSNLAAKVESQIKTFSTFVEELTRVNESCSLHLAALKTQMIMVDFFVRESIDKLAQDEDAFSGMLSNREVFTDLFSSSVKKLDSELVNLKNRLNYVSVQIKEIQKLISGLEVIKQTGAIESARKDEIKTSFNYYLTEMDSFTAILRRTVSELNEHREILIKSTNEINNSTDQVSGNIHQVFELALLNR